MKDQIYNMFNAVGELTVQEIATNICMSAVLGFVIFLSYYISHRGTIYSKKFNVSLVALTVLTGTVMTVIGNNIALSLGMVGALSIVRFRIAIKDSRYTIYIFWTVIVGICCGVGDFVVAAIGSTVAFVTLFFLGAIKNDNRMLIIIRGTRNKQSIVSGYMFKLFKSKAILRVKNTTDETMELIYEVSSRTLNTKMYLLSKKLGCRIALDDFGSGYTSFRDLCEYPVDIIKVDRDIVTRSSSARGYAVLVGIIQMAHALRIRVLCEGIETENENKRAIDAECDYIQGFMYSRVLPLENAIDLYNRHN